MTKTAGSIALMLLGLASASPVAAQSRPTPGDPMTPVTEVRPQVDVVEEGALFRALGVGMFAASAGDLASTEWGLGRPGIYEANPLASNRNVRLSTHLVVPAAVWWTTKRLHQDGHEKAALWIRIAVTAAYGYAVMHNLRTAGSPPVR